MTILPKETIQTIAQGIGINNLPDEVAAALAPDVEYRMREIMQEAIKCMLHSKRTILTTDDVNSALQLRNIEPLFGFVSGGPLRFKRALGHNDLFYIDDGEVELKKVMEAPLPKAPLDTAVVAHWLAIEGVQPAIPENIPLEALAPSLDSHKLDTILSRKKDEEFGVEVKLPVKHVLSQELQLYFEKITELIINRADSVLFKAALNSLATDSGLHPLVPYFTQFIADEVIRNLNDLQLLFALMRVVRSLLINPHIQIDLYLHQLMPSVITCLVAKQLGSKSMEGHWELRDYVANLIAFICRRFGRSYHNLQPRITKTLLQAFLDPKKAMTQHYGGVKGLAALGPRVVGLMILPNVEAYLQLLAPEMSLETQKNEMKRYEAMCVYGTLLNALGLCMSSRLKSCPMFFWPRAWNPGGKGRILTSASLQRGSLSNILAPQQLPSSSRRIGDSDGIDSQQKRPMNESFSVDGPSFDSSIVTYEHTHSQQTEASRSGARVADNDLSEQRTQAQNHDRTGYSLSDAWKEDAALGPLLASLIELFGDGILPFVPTAELNMFL